MSEDSEKILGESLHAMAQDIKERDAETLKAHLELAFEVQRLQQAEADELIEKLRAEIERLRDRLNMLQELVHENDEFLRAYILGVDVPGGARQAIELRKKVRNIF
jgi:hypothetical protein